MVITLLILIAAILLFGAGAVRGWLLNAAGVVLGLIIACAAMIWINVEFGLTGFVVVACIIGALLIAGKVWADGQA